MTLPRGASLLTAALLAAGAAAQPPDPPAAQDGPFVVIAHPEHGEQSIDRERLARIFLGRETAWSDERPIVPVDLSTRSSTRRSFASHVMGMSIGEVIRHWRAMPEDAPEVASSEEDAVGRVAATAGAVGYVGRETELRGVRVLTLID
jgi:ABC-type phosphate transport system substrate-binding protein